MPIQDYRRLYAEEVRTAAPITSHALLTAFEKVPREKFLGPGPWFAGSRELETNDVRDLYHDVTVAIDRERGINNGQPSALALWMDALDLAPGDRVFHLGCGVGYYTAILAEVVGGSGSVAAIEIEPDLAGRARQNLLDYPNVTVHEGDGALFDPGVCDAIFINAGVTHPQARWLEQLPGYGRMVLPLTTRVPTKRGGRGGQGAVIRIVRQRGFSAEFISYAVIYSSSSMRDPLLEAPLAKALERKALPRLRSVLLEKHEETDTCLVHGADVCLSSAQI